MSARYMMRELPGGMRLGHAEVAESECAAVSIYVPVGSRDEVGGVPEGLAHFVEHMVFKGTEGRSAKELTLAVESGGGQTNACTTEEYTVYEAQGEAELMPVLIDVLSDMVWHSVYPEGEVELEREVIGEEIVMIRESPAEHIYDMLAGATWPGHALGQSISGSLQTIKRIGRGDLVNFAERHHFRRDVVIATAGPMSMDKVLEELLPRLPGRVEKVPERAQYEGGGVLEVVEKRSTDQLQLGLAWHTPGREGKDRHALRLLSLILGESSSSRLFTRLREEHGLCYQIGSEVSLFEEVGALQVTAGLDVESRDEALEMIYEEVEDLAGKGPRDGELERAKRLAVAQSKFAFESTAAHAAWAGEGLLFLGRIPTAQEVRESLLAVTERQVREVAARIFSCDAARAEIRSR